MSGVTPEQSWGVSAARREDVALKNGRLPQPRDGGQCRPGYETATVTRT
ncbi:hypothetical protein [Nonomuraea sp. NPDC003201]